MPGMRGGRRGYNVAERMRRRLFKLAACLSLFLGMSVVTLWVLSSYRSVGVSVGEPATRRYVTVATLPGRLLLMRQQHDGPSVGGYAWNAWCGRSGIRPQPPGFIPRDGWFGFKRQHIPLPTPGMRQSALDSVQFTRGSHDSYSVPFWAITLALIAPWAVAGWHRFLHWNLAWQRLATGRCERCGYDLRGSRGRCPECGAAFDGGPNHARPVDRALSPNENCPIIR